METEVVVLDGGWKNVQLELNIGAEPIFDSWVDTGSGLFDEGEVCHWTPDIEISAVDWDGCAEAYVALAEAFAAD